MNVNAFRSARRVVTSGYSATTLPAHRNSLISLDLRTKHLHGIRAINNQPAYDGHIPLNWFENAFLAVGSAVMSLVDPRRGGEVYILLPQFSQINRSEIDMIAALGETTAGSSLSCLRDLMLESSEGRGVLRDRPRVNSSTIDMNKLAQYPDGSFGRAYVTWLERCGVTPDTREPVRNLTTESFAVDH
jgi:ubiquinone biosynthesis protein COQ4